MDVSKKEKDAYKKFVEAIEGKLLHVSSSILGTHSNHFKVCYLKLLLKQVLFHQIQNSQANNH